MIVQRAFGDLSLEEVQKLASGEWVEVSRLDINPQIGDSLLFIEVPEGSLPEDPKEGRWGHGSESGLEGRWEGPE